ncbi:MAG: glycogen-binding domain-containing protein [Planctomycetota bacterium]
MVKKDESCEKNNRQSFVQVIFVCDLKPEASEVFLVGNFNDWDPRSDRMHKIEDRFQKIKKLSPGEHQYKFVVDGVWHTDPRTALQMPNDQGGVNSLIRI